MWYTDGLVSVTNNSASVVGSGTRFLDNARNGDAFIGPDGLLYQVLNIVSQTQMAIKPNYKSASAAGQAYSIAPIQGYVKMAADRLWQILNQLTPGDSGAPPIIISATAPPSPVPLMTWVDVSGNTPVERLRNDANTAWIVIRPDYRVPFGTAATMAATSSAAPPNGQLWRTDDLVKQFISHDKVAGKVAVNNTVGGFFGIGCLNPGVGSSMKSSDEELETGFYRVNIAEGSTDIPPGISYGPLINARFSTATSVKIAAATGNDTMAFKRTGGAWRSLWHDGNLPVESGTFTATVSGTTTAGSATYQVRTGRYTKIGNVVNFQIILQWSGHTGAGNMVISGLPFTSSSGAENAVLSPYFDGLSFVEGGSLYPIIITNQNIITMRTCSPNAGPAYVPMAGNATVNSLRISGTYLTNS